ncbi:MAG: hypothetical protein U0703_13340 [Anaerolineae bacterium]
MRGFEYGGHVDGFGQNAINQMHHAGMTWVKRQIHAFQDVAAPPSTKRTPTACILSGLPASRAQRSPTTATLLDQYAQTVATAAAQGADAIEVFWNEPNLDREWASGQISPQRYTGMLRRAYNAIKAANPEHAGDHAAPAPTGYFGGAARQAATTRRSFAAWRRRRHHLDCVGVHYNEGIIAPNQTSGDPRESGGFYTRYFWGMVNTLLQRFRRREEAVLHRAGYLTPEGYGPLPGSFAWASNVTVAQQAAWLDQAVSLAANSGKVRMMIIWNIDFGRYDLTRWRAMPSSDHMASLALALPLRTNPRTQRPLTRGHVPRVCLQVEP